MHANDRRSVSLEPGRADRIVKRFHRSGWLGSLGDHRRARREFAVLRHLRARAVPVPEAHEIRRGERGWEVVLTAVDGARSLEELLRARQEPAAGWEHLLAELGRALARIQATRVRWSDAHAGNVLVDRAGHPWLIDFHQAAWRVRAGGRAPLDDLVHAAAIGREAFPARSRLRFLAAWKRERERLGEEAPHFATADLERLEERARAQRRADVEHGAGRWLRASSRVRVGRTRDGVVIERREPPAPEAGAPLVLAGLAREDARARWLHAARLEEHGVPVLRPLRLELGRSASALVLERATLAPPLAPGLAQENLGRLLGALHERGLDVERLAAGDLVPLASGALAVLPPHWLGAIDARGVDPARLAPDGDDAATAVFVAAYWKALRAAPELPRSRGVRPASDSRSERAHASGAPLREPRRVRARALAHAHAG